MLALPPGNNGGGTAEAAPPQSADQGMAQLALCVTLPSSKPWLRASRRLGWLRPLRKHKAVREAKKRQAAGAEAGIEREKAAATQVGVLTSHVPRDQTRASSPRGDRELVFYS